MMMKRLATFFLFKEVDYSTTHSSSGKCKQKKKRKKDFPIKKLVIRVGKHICFYGAEQSLNLFFSLSFGRGP